MGGGGGGGGGGGVCGSKVAPSLLDSLSLYRDAGVGQQDHPDRCRNSALTYKEAGNTSGKQHESR